MATSSAIPKETPSFFYQCGLFLVAVMMLILPVIYAGLTVLAGYGVYYFAVNYFPQIWEWRMGRSGYVVIFQIICSCTPLLVGGTIALFMVKPFFAGSGRRMQPLAVNPELDTEIYSLVQQICQLVGTRPPRRIELDCHLNASASFDGGWRGFFSDQRILTLGMPLVAGLTARELSGVIAHEFGHFRQGAGMRLSYIIRTVNFWFARVVYARDGWDEMLEAHSNGDTAWINFMVGCARFGVWLSRRVLWLLMMAGHCVSAFLLRQMEYDADRVEIRLAGSAAFESATLKLAALGVVFNDIHRNMAKVWRKQLQLPDNLPVLLAYRIDHLDAKERAKIEAQVGLNKTSFTDTHPSDGDRVQQARKMAEPGFDIPDFPARELFGSFDTVSRLVTLTYYDDELNVPTDPEYLIPLEHVIRGKREQQAAGIAVATESAAATGSPIDPATTAPARPAAPAKPAVPMMSYDPSKFQKPKSPEQTE